MGAIARIVEERRVVITGVGAITPLGPDVPTFWQGLREGRSGVRRIQSFDVSDYSTQIAAEVPEFLPERYMDRKDAKRMDRFTQLAVAATREAFADAGLTSGGWQPEEVGVILGTGIGGIQTFADQQDTLRTKGPGRVSPFFIPMMIANMAAGQIAILFGLKGPNHTVVTACSSSANAVGDAYRLLARGEAEVILAGGSEAVIVPLALAGFCSMKALSTRNDDPAAASRPFDLGRDGFVMGEGAGMLVLESWERATRRGAKIYAEVVGFGQTADAYHIVQPAPLGEGAGRAMQRALADAAIEPGQIGYINAHGTSTPPGDIGEIQAIKQVFGPAAHRLAVSSTKSMTGHLLGAAGAVETIVTALALRDGVLPPTINQTDSDPECDLDVVPNQARRQEVEWAMSNSFGFGGQNTSLILRRVR